MMEGIQFLSTFLIIVFITKIYSKDGWGSPVPEPTAPPPVPVPSPAEELLEVRSRLVAQDFKKGSDYLA